MTTRITGDKQLIIDPTSTPVPSSASPTPTQQVSNLGVQQTLSAFPAQGVNRAAPGGSMLASFAASVGGDTDPWTGMNTDSIRTDEGVFTDAIVGGGLSAALRSRGMSAERPLLVGTFEYKAPNTEDTVSLWRG